MILHTIVNELEIFMEQEQLEPGQLTNKLPQQSNTQKFPIFSTNPKDYLPNTNTQNTQI